MLKDKVLGRCYYYLLDFNEYDNWETIIKMFNKTKLNELTVEEFWQLFKVATQKDLINKIE